MRRQAAVLLLGASIAGVVSPALGGEPPGQPMIGQAAPAFRLPDLRGGALALEDLKGRFVVLHFGASW